MILNQDVTWYPNTSNDAWLRLFPLLKKQLPIKCDFCGLSPKTYRPMVNRYFVGFESKCVCGNNPQIVIMRVKNNKK